MLRAIKSIATKLATKLAPYGKVGGLTLAVSLAEGSLGLMKLAKRYAELKAATPLEEALFTAVDVVAPTLRESRHLRLIQGGLA